MSLAVLNMKQDVTSARLPLSAEIGKAAYLRHGFPDATIDRDDDVRSGIRTLYFSSC